jgi:hypothetical protein
MEAQVIPFLPPGVDFLNQFQQQFTGKTGVDVIIIIFGRY